jgi:aminopeptidase N
VEKKANADGTSTYRYVTGPMRDLVGTMSPRYQSASLKAGETTVTSYFLERDRVWGERAARFAVDSLIIFNDLYGQYPYAEYKLAEVALDEFGGFEFPAMTLITTRYYKDSMALSMENVVAHETAHQWWYGLVGSDQILEAWQDEGLCQYSPVLYFERFHSKTEGQRILEIYMLSGFRNLVDSGLDDVVNQPVFAWKNFNTYLMVVYNKGGAFYNAYRTTFGDTAFKRFAGYYFERNRYKFVSEDAILEALRYGAGVGQEQAANELIRRWLNSKEGYKDR